MRPGLVSAGHEEDPLHNRLIAIELAKANADPLRAQPLAASKQSCMLGQVGSPAVESFMLTFWKVAATCCFALTCFGFYHACSPARGAAFKLLLQAPPSFLWLCGVSINCDSCLLGVWKKTRRLGVNKIPVRRCNDRVHRGRPGMAALAALTWLWWRLAFGLQVTMCYLTDAQGNLTEDLPLWSSCKT